MKDKNAIKEWQADLERTLCRLEDRSRLVKANPEADLAATWAYNDFKDRLLAAAYTRVLEKPNQIMTSHLRAAGEAALDVFRRQGTTLGEITNLPSFEREYFVDDSAIIPETFVDACYAFLAAGEAHRLVELQAAAIEAGMFENPDLDPEAIEVAMILIDISTGRIRQSSKSSKACHPIENEYRWSVERHVLELIIQHSTTEFDDYLEDLSEALDQDIVKSDRTQAPTRLLKLEILGLRALAALSPTCTFETPTDKSL